jgi:Putative auto-transporter adhesin, head GIN domain
MNVSVRSAFVLCALGLFACTDEWGDGKRVSEERDISDFTAVDNSGELEVVIDQGDEFALTVAIDSNLIDRVETRVVDDTLRIRTRGQIDGIVKGPHVRITMPVLSGVHVSGGGDVNAGDFAESEEVDLDVSGAGNLVWQGAARAINASVSGAGDLSLDGSTDSLVLHVSGAGDAKARECVAQDATVEVSGSGDATVDVRGNLDAEVSGAGDLDVYGDPHFTRRERSGAGSLSAH